MTDIDKIFIQLLILITGLYNHKVDKVPFTVAVCIIGAAWAYFG